WQIQRAHTEVNSGRAALPDFLLELCDHAPAIPLPSRALQQIDVQVGRIFLVRLGAEILRMMISVVSHLYARPLARVARRLGKLSAQLWAPFVFVTMIKSA